MSCALLAGHGADSLLGSTVHAGMFNNLHTRLPLVFSTYTRATEQHTFPL